MKYQFTVDAIDLETTHGKVLNQIRPNSCVLECGCATGYITKFMKEQLGCKVHIIEYEQEAFDIARQYAEGGVCGDLTADNWTAAFAGMQFDYILFMDVLEHLPSPEKTLQQAATLLKHDGTVLISLPNIAHNDILINLYQNAFNYSDVGLLDNTHIHFYGRNNLSALVRSAGLEMTKIDKTYVKTGTSELFWKEECKIPADLLPVLGPGAVYIPFAVIRFIGGEWFPAAAILVFYLITIVIRQIVEPRIVSSAVRLSPALILVTVYVSIVSMNVWILFYVMILALLYRILKASGVIGNSLDRSGE